MGVGDPVSLDLDSQDTLELSPRFRHKPVKIHVAGTVCKGWSAAGSKEQFSHESERPHAVWVTERKAWAEQFLEDVFSKSALRLTQWMNDEK